MLSNLLKIILSISLYIRITWVAFNKLPHPLAPWLPWWLSGKESACSAGDMGSIPGLGRFPGEGNGYPLQYSCLENPMDRGASQTIVHGDTESDTTERLTFSVLFFHLHPRPFN